MFLSSSYLQRVIDQCKTQLESNGQGVAVAIGVAPYRHEDLSYAVWRLRHKRDGAVLRMSDNRARS